MKRLVRIELTRVAWKATVLPLNYRRIRKSEYAEISIFFATKKNQKIKIVKSMGFFGFSQALAFVLALAFFQTIL